MQKSGIKVPLGMAEIVETLYARFLKADPNEPLWADRIRVVLSNGRGSMLLYGIVMCGRLGFCK